MGEKNRLETTLREEETRVRKEEADLKLAEQAFDNFLQENDRKAMEAQKKAEQEAKITSEKDEHIKSVEAEILQLKADIYNLKDVFRKFSMYGKFLATISPEEWRREQEAAAKRNRTRVPPSIQAIYQFLKKELSKPSTFIQAVLRLDEGESLEDARIWATDMSPGVGGGHYEKINMQSVAGSQQYESIRNMQTQVS